MAEPTVRYALIPLDLTPGDMLAVGNDGNIVGRKIDAFNVRGSVNNVAARDALTGMVPGDLYVLRDSGHVHMWTGTDWEDIGPFPASAGSGTLTARPSPGSVQLGTVYFAENDNGGTLYTKKTGDVWTQSAPSMSAAAAGSIIRSVWPSSTAPVTADSMGECVFPEMVSTFIWPSTGHVRMIIPPIAISCSALAAATSYARVIAYYKVDGGAWRFARFLIGPTMPIGSTSANFPGGIVRLPYPSATGADDLPDPGDSVQVRIALGGLPAGTTNVNFSINALFGSWAGYDVVQF